MDVVDFMAQPAAGVRPVRKPRAAAATRVTADELERILWAHPGTHATRHDGRATVVVNGRTYVAQIEEVAA